MSFESRYKTSAGEICPICRKIYYDGRSPDNPAYHVGSENMCRDCMKRYYRNRNDKRTAAYTDDSANLLTRLRPAQILERPRFIKRAEPPGGYEFTMPELCEHKIVYEVLIWLMLCIAVKLLSITVSSENVSISMTVLNILITGISALWAVKNLWLLIKGLFLGMGHSRRILLAASVIALILLVWQSLPSYLF